MKEFGEAIKTQLAASNPVKLRKQELEQEKRRSSMGKKMTRSPSRKRNSSVTQYRDKSPDNASVSRASSNFGPSSILKSNKKLKKMRPKTAERANSRMNSGYKPTRTVYKPEISASAG